MDNGGKERYGAILRCRMQGTMTLACKRHEYGTSELPSIRHEYGTSEIFRASINNVGMRLSCLESRKKQLYITLIPVVQSRIDNGRINHGSISESADQTTECAICR